MPPTAHLACWESFARKKDGVFKPVLSARKVPLVINAHMEPLDSGGGEGAAPAPQCCVTRTPKGWEASFEQKLLGAYATEELAVRSLDLLRLKRCLDDGCSPDAAELQLPLEVR